MDGGPTPPEAMLCDDSVSGGPPAVESASEPCLGMLGAETVGEQLPVHADDSDDADADADSPEPSSGAVEEGGNGDGDGGDGGGDSKVDVEADEVIGGGDGAADDGDMVADTAVGEEEKKAVEGASSEDGEAVEGQEEDAPEPPSEPEPEPEPVPPPPDLTYSSMALKGSDINAAVLAACGRDSLPDLQALLAHPDAWINYRDRLGWSALLKASFFGNVDVVAEVLRHSPSLNHTNKLDQGAVYLAASRGHVKVIDLLVEAGVRPNAGEDPLLAAASHGHLGAVRRLLELGCNVNARAEVSGATPLVCAAAEGHTKVVATLLEAGADPTAVNNENDSALALARDFEFEDIVTLLGGDVKDEEEEADAHTDETAETPAKPAHC